MKVEIIEKSSAYDLEKAVNKFIEGRSDVLDIKYSGCGSFPVYGCKYYSAMIIMG